jgi:hypothetical protein
MLGSGRDQQAREGGATDLTEQLVDGARQAQGAVLDEAVEELRHERVEPMGTDAAGGVPEHRGHLGHLRAVGAGAPTGTGCRPWPRGAPHEPDGGLAMNSRDRHDFVQQLLLFGPSRPHRARCGTRRLRPRRPAVRSALYPAPPRPLPPAPAATTAVPPAERMPPGSPRSALTPLPSRCSAPSWAVSASPAFPAPVIRLVANRRLHRVLFVLHTH